MLPLAAEVRRAGRGREGAAGAGPRPVGGVRTPRLSGALPPASRHQALGSAGMRKHYAQAAPGAPGAVNTISLTWEISRGQRVGGGAAAGRGHQWSAPSPSRACHGPRTGRLPPCALVSPSGTNESGINSGPGSVSSWKEPGRWGHMGLDPFSAVGGWGALILATLPLGACCGPGPQPESQLPRVASC